MRLEIHSIKALAIAMAAIALFLAAPAAQATDYYVSTTGNNNNTGSSGSPWRTLQKAADTMAPGDVTHVANGTYAGVYIGRGGTFSALITFKAEGQNVIVNSRNSVTADNINIEGADYIVIDGFKVEDAPRVGIRIVNATGVIIRNNVVARSDLTGILTGWTPEIQIISNVCYGASREHGIYVSNSSAADDNVVVRGNESYGNGQNGIQLNGDCWEGGDGVVSGALIEDNLVHDNNWKGFSLISVQNSIIQNNVIYNNGISAGAGGIHLADQPDCSKPSNNNVVVNNTIVEPRIAGIRITNGSAGNVIFNCLVVANTSDYTIVDETGGNFIDDVSNLLFTSSAGLFVDAANADYHLAASSPVADAGLASYQSKPAPSFDRDGKNRPIGNAYDPGAYERGSATPDAVPPTVAITAPTNNQTVSGIVTIGAAANDNVGVAGVQFRVDGGNLGPEVAQAPYQRSLTTTTFTNGNHTLTAVARDGAGNTTTSSAVAVVVDNQAAPAGILANHPRLVLIPARLAEIRAAACYDANGNPISGCTPSPQWTTFRNWVQTCYTNPGYCYIVQPWAFALYYMITGNVAYANRAISLVDAEIADGLEEERNDFFLHADDNVQDCAYVFDWCYNMLSADKKATYIDYMNRIVQEIYVEDPYDNPFFVDDRWATNDPGNNYYYAQMQCATFAALATYGENDFTVPLSGNNVPLELYFHDEGRAYNDILEFLYAKLEGEAIGQWISYRGEGGGWHEGTQYGTAALNQILAIYLHLRDAGAKDYFTTTPFPRSALNFFLFLNQPGNEVRYNGGDAGRDKDNPLSPYERETAILLARGLYPGIDSQYAQYWANHVMPDMGTGWQHMYPPDLAWSNMNYPERDYRELETAYFAEGLGWMNSRSSWNPDAVSVTYICSDRVQNHQHKDQSSFVIYKGEGIDGWQAIDANQCDESNGVYKNGYIHNTLLVNGEDQRYGDGTGTVLKHEITPEYRYIVGDAADAYWTNPSGYSHGDDPYLSVFIRELVHVLPGYVVVYDRVTPKPNFANVDITYVLNTRNAPTISGNTVTATSSGNKLVQKTLLPASDFTMTTGNSLGCYHVNLERNTPASPTQFLNVLFTGTGTSTMPPTELVTSTTDNMVGAHIKESGNNIVLMFSADPSGAVPQGSIIYELSTIENSQHYLFGLVPDAEYRVEVVNNSGRQTIVVTRGDGYATSPEGTLRFEARYEFAPAPKVLASR